MDDVTLASLATVAGATAGAAIVVQFVGAVAALSTTAKRLLSLFSGAVLLVGAVFVINPSPDAGLLVLAAFNGMIAGLAASQAYQTATKGLDAKVVEKFDEGFNPGDYGYKPPTV